MRVKRTNGLTSRQEAAILALLNHPTVEKAAEAIGVTDRTIYRWLEEPAFKKTYRAARRESFKHAVSLCQKYLPHAIQTLVKVMADNDAPHAAKVSAATALMKFSREGLELDDMAERIEKLEADSAAREAAGPPPGGYGYGDRTAA